MYECAWYRRDIQQFIFLYVLGHYTTTVFKTKYNFVYILTSIKINWLCQSLFLRKNNLE